MATQRQVNREKAVAAIIEAASEEFAENGYTGAKIRSIASRAGVALGLVNTYFESKDNLLCRIVNRYNLTLMYEGVTETDPYRIFCIYMDHVRALQRENPVRFRLILRIVSESDFPDSVYDTIRANFEGSLLERAVLELQKDGEMIKGDAFSIFKILSGSVYVLLNQYEKIGIEAPDNDDLMHILGYNRRKKEYMEQSNKLSRMEKDLKLLMEAVRANYPLSISINLTKDSYHMIDYDNYYTHKADEEGRYDDLIRAGALTVPNEADRMKFMELFGRESLLQAFRDGERERSLVHLQTGDDGVDRYVSTRCMMKENDDGEIIAISIGGAVDNHIRREIENIDLYKDQSLLREILNNIGEENAAALRTPADGLSSSSV